MTYAPPIGITASTLGSPPLRELVDAMTKADLRVLSFWPAATYQRARADGWSDRDVRKLLRREAVVAGVATLLENRMRDGEPCLAERLAFEHRDRGHGGKRSGRRITPKGDRCTPNRPITLPWPITIPRKERAP